MDFSLNDHQKLIRDTVRQFMENEVRHSVRQRDREGRYPAAEVKKLAELGCCGMLVPEEWGGPGLDTVSYVLMLEEVARVDAAMATSLSVTNSAVQAPLLAFGNDAQKKKYLRRMASGEILASFCLTEPQAGSDAAGIQARAVQSENVGAGLKPGEPILGQNIHGLEGGIYLPLSHHVLKNLELAELYAGVGLETVWAAQITLVGRNKHECGRRRGDLLEMCFKIAPKREV